MNKLNIALDGPAGAGKSTIARMLAKELGYIYIDTGAMYRAVTWKMLQSGLEPYQHEEIIKMAADMDIELIPGNSSQIVKVDSIDITGEIRSNIVNKHVPLVAQISQIRTLMVQKQQEMAERKGVVMDGRDIGTQVLPNAELKLFLTASIRERAKRRWKEMQQEQDDLLTLEQVEEELMRRDRLDEEREVSPLIRAKDALVIDSTDKSPEQIVQYIMELCHKKVHGGNDQP